MLLESSLHLNVPFRGYVLCSYKDLPYTFWDVQMLDGSCMGYLSHQFRRVKAQLFGSLQPRSPLARVVGVRPVADVFDALFIGHLADPAEKLLFAPVTPGRRIVLELVDVEFAGCDYDVSSADCFCQPLGLGEFARNVGLARSGNGRKP